MKITAIASILATAFSLRLENTSTASTLANVFAEGTSTCADIRPKSGSAGTVTINYYTNTAGGKTGDACSSCGGAVMDSNTFWADPAYYAVCTTWPGHSGANSMTNGICGAGNSFTID